MVIFVAIVGFLVVLGLFSAMHGVIAPVVDWLYPPVNQPPSAPETEAGNDARLIRQRERERDIRRMAQIKRKEEKRLQRDLAVMERQHADQSAEWEIERAHFWREIEAIKRNAPHSEP